MPNVITPALTKCQQLLQILTNALDHGTYEPGDRMPSESELVVAYGVGKSTIREAISALVLQGRLTRIQGKGTFVAEQRRPRIKTFALFLKSHGHVYGQQTQAIVRALQKERAIPMVFDLNAFGISEGRVPTESFLHEVMDEDLDAIITEGNTRWIVRSYARLGRPCPSLAVINHTDADDPADVRVLTDTRQGTALGTRYLMELGHQDIMFVVHRNPYLSPDTSPERASGIYGQIAGGYCETVAETGQPRYFIIEDEFKTDDTRTRLRDLLRSSERPTAVFAYEDFRAKCVMDIAMEVGLSVPDDLSVLGYFNTPWGKHTTVPLSSVSTCEGVIARRVVELLLGNSAGWQNVIGPGPIVTKNLCCVFPHKKGPVVGKALRQTTGLCNRELKVLRC